MPDSTVSSCTERRLQILGIEDDPIHQLFLTRALGKAGHDIVIAGSGSDAYRIFTERQFDVILLDMNLPDLPGQDIALGLQDLATTLGRRKPPILCMSAQDKHEVDNSLQEICAHGFLPKPIQLASLREAVLLAASSAGAAA